MPRKTSKPSPTRSARQQTDSASRPPQPSLKRELTPSLKRELKPSLKRELKPGDAIRRARSAGKSVGIAVSRAARPMLLPDELAALLADALDAHANGHRVELVVHAKTKAEAKAEAKAGAGGAHSHYLILDRDPNEELTTQQAAEALKVSRPTIIQAIEDGRLAARKVGKHRRVRVYDFNAFARAEHATRVAHARESDRMEQELGLYDIPLPESITEWKRTAGRIKSVAKASARRGKR